MRGPGVRGFPQAILLSPEPSRLPGQPQFPDSSEALYGTRVLRAYVFILYSLFGRFASPPRVQLYRRPADIYLLPYIGLSVARLPPVLRLLLACVYTL